MNAISSERGLLVSIIIPAYNAQIFIEQTIRSAINQSYQHIEIIVIDDGSTDGTRSIVERLAAVDPRIQIISIPNGGVARARNLGIEKAAGEFVAFLDADDIWHPYKIDEQVFALLKRGAGWAACYALHRKLDTEDRIKGTGSTLTCSGYIFARHLFAKFVSNGSSLLVYRDAALEVGGFDPSYAAQGLGGCEDLDFELKLAAKYRIVGVPRLLVGYRDYPGNMSSDRLRMARAIVLTVDRHLAAHPELPVDAKRYARAATQHYACLLLMRDRRLVMAIRAILVILWNDPLCAVRAFASATRLLTRKIVGKVWRPAAINNNRLLFFEIAPNDGLNVSESAFRQRRLKQLEAIDAVLEKQLFGKGEGETH